MGIVLRLLGTALTGIVVGAGDVELAVEVLTGKRRL